MYQPKHWHWIAPTMIALIPFYIRTNYGIDWSVHLFVNAPLAVVSMMMSAYLFKAGVIWQEFEADWNAPGDKKPQVAKPASVPYNDMGRSGMVQLPQIVQAPKISNEQKFYKTLIDMRNSNLEVDLRESFWISPINRYGESRESFVSMKDSGVQCGALCRVGERRNAPHAVFSWQKVRMLAGGYPLPRAPKP